MTDLLNTHSYDGRIDINQIPELGPLKLLSLEQKRDVGSQLITALRSIINPQALSYLTGIVNSMGTSANIDPTNNLIADDLIYLCWVYHQNSEFISILEVQLMDMSTGFCPQGRTHRLFQSILPFI
jgi:hypothetical protein